MIQQLACDRPDRRLPRSRHLPVANNRGKSTAKLSSQLSEAERGFISTVYSAALIASNLLRAPPTSPGRSWRRSLPLSLAQSARLARLAAWVIVAGGNPCE
jgi:hypothetical protein